MRILQVVHQLPPQYVGGVELITAALARDLRAQKHAVHVLGRATTDARTGDDVTVLPDAGQGVRRFAATWRDPAALRTALACIDRFRPDVAHIQHLMGLPLALMDALRRRGIPFVVTLHDYWFACANAQLVTNFDNSQCDGPVDLKCARCAAARSGLPDFAAPAFTPVMRNRNVRLREILACASAVTAPSRGVIAWFAEHGFDATGWRVVAYGLSGAPVPPEPPNSVPHFAYIGGLSEQKGAHILIDAFNAMPPDATLTIAGPLDVFPDYVARLCARARHPGIAFVGALQREDVWRTLARTDALIAPSLWPETYMLVAHEALAAGCALIASNIGALADLATRHDAAVTLIPPGDADALRIALRSIRPGERRIRAHRDTVDYASDMARLYAEVTRP